MTTLDELGCEPGGLYIVYKNGDEDKAMPVSFSEAGDALTRFEQQNIQAKLVRYAVPPGEVPPKAPGRVRIRDLPLSARSGYALMSAGFKYLDQLEGIPESDLLGIRGLGRKSLNEIRKICDLYRIRLKPTSKLMDARQHKGAVQEKIKRLEQQLVKAYQELECAKQREDKERAAQKGEAQLDERSERAVELRIEGKTYKQIGQELGVSAATADKILWTAVWALREKAYAKHPLHEEAKRLKKGWERGVGE